MDGRRIFNLDLLSPGHFPRFFGTCTFTWWVEEAPAVSVQVIVIV